MHSTQHHVEIRVEFNKIDLDLNFIAMELSSKIWKQLNSKENWTLILNTCKLKITIKSCIVVIEI